MGLFLSERGETESGTGPKHLSAESTVPAVDPGAAENTSSRHSPGDTDSESAKQGKAS